MIISKDLLKIEESIPDTVLEFANKYALWHTQFVSYLEKFNDEILMRSFAFKKPINKDLCITEVTRRLTGFSGYFVKNCYFTYLSGYNAVYSKNDIITHNCDMLEEDFDDWYFRDDNYFKVGYKIINLDLINETKYKYCAFNDCYNFFIDYINLYLNYPGLEFISKIGIKKLSKLLLDKASKDKQFRKFIKENVNDINIYGVIVSIFAYNHKMSIYDASKWLMLGKEIKELLETNIDRLKLYKYLTENNISYRLYNDYLMAIKYLRLDLSNTKNVFPQNFIHMHDLRIQEYDSLKLKETLKSKRSLNSKVHKVALFYSNLNLDDKYIVHIANSIKELIIEGNVLNHCVGKMGYDLKMANKESLIFFIRKKEEPNRPYVTMEFDLSQKKILQIYAKNNAKPDNEVLKFVNNKWLKYAKEKLKEVC